LKLQVRRWPQRFEILPTGCLQEAYFLRREIVEISGEDPVEN